MVSMDQREVSQRGTDIKIYVRDVRDPEQKKRALTVRSWSTIKDVKDILKDLIHVPPSAQRLYYGPLLTTKGELPNHRSLHDAGIYRSGETLLLDIKQSHSTATTHYSSIVSLHQSNDICVSSSVFDITPKPLRAVVQKARRAFTIGLKPEFIMDGSGGSYFIHDARKSRIAVFKPADEEPYAENNPRSYIQQGTQQLSLREGIIPGEACLREVAAYLLDHDHFSSVPMTTLVEARHPAFNTNGARLTVAEGGASVGRHSLSPNAHVSSPTMKKAGSFQEFVRCECTMDDISPSMISVEEVHKIAILDIRIMNADRNAANLLIRRRVDNSLELVPIDHGFCLRSVGDVSWMDWCWLDWPQLKQPLSDHHKKYIEKLDIEKDAEMLRSRLGICQEAIDYFRASTALLKAGVEAGLNLYEIAILCCRNDNLAEIPSMMEKLFAMASDLAHKAVENERWHHAAASLAIEEKLTPQRRSTIADTQARLAGYKIRKSASSLGFHSLESTSSGSFYGGEGLSGRDSPGMIQSSASDSSSEGDVVADQEECEEWAMNAIADATAGNHVQTQQGRPERSCSIASDDCSNGSRKGFWTVAPGSAVAPVEPSDDGSFSWSPQASPRPSSDQDHSIPSSPKSMKVSFTNKLPSGPFIPPSTVAVAKTSAESDFPYLFRSESGMTRSKSYSSIPRESSSSRGAPWDRRTLKPYSEAYENYRKYFHKFIDLVIVRETTAAALQSKE